MAHDTRGRTVAMPSLMDRLLRRRTQQLKVSRELAEAASDHLLEMDDRLEQLAELPGLEAFASTRVLPRGFFELWDQALAAYDRYLETMTGSGGLSVRCQAGCAACCHEAPTGVQAVELLAIYERYREFPDFAELHNRACDLADQLTALLAEQAPGEQQIDSSSPEAARALLAYRSRRLPCVFLGPDSRCRIYDRRPIPCRMHFAVTEPQWCEADDPHAEDAITPNLEPPADMLVHMKTIARRLGLDGLSPTLFQGLGLLGGQVLQTKRLVRDKAKRRRHPHG
jgi:Fe-S-cluster containining protein